MADPNLRVVHRVRLNSADAHYGGDLVDGARILQLFGDAATELCIRESGDEGLFRAYEEVDFFKPVHAGDFLEIHAEILETGNTSRKMAFKAYKVIETSRDPANPSAARILEEPLLVAQAVGTCVVKKQNSGE